LAAALVTSVFVVAVGGGAVFALTLGSSRAPLDRLRVHVVDRHDALGYKARR
jgi:hypothetical protein